jgi:hypothetical protein
MSYHKKTPLSQDSSFPETKEKPTQPNNDNLDNFGLPALLRGILQEETRSSIIERGIKALTALGSKSNDERTVKENRVKGKSSKIMPRKLIVAKVYAELKEKNKKNPTLKELVKALEKQYPERPKTNEDAGQKPWTEAGVKPWHTALNQGKSF